MFGNQPLYLGFRLGEKPHHFSRFSKLPSVLYSVAMVSQVSRSDRRRRFSALLRVLGIISNNPTR